MKYKSNNIFLLVLINFMVALVLICGFTFLSSYTIYSDYGICRGLSWVVLAALVVFAGVMDYSLLFAKESTIDAKAHDIDSCIGELEKYMAHVGKKTPWNGQILKAIEYAERFHQHKETLNRLSRAKFGDEAEIIEYERVISDLENSVVKTMQHILTRLCIMDEKVFAQAMRTRDNDTLARYRIHEEYINSQMEFEKKIVYAFADLITEVSLIGDENDEGGMNNVQDIIMAIRKLNNNQYNELEELEAKYKAMS